MHPLQTINFIHHNSAYVVEASAGTGKTWTIERLFIKALLEARALNNDNIPISIDNILVVTFTNDATDELKQRIQEQIHAAIRQIILLHNQPDFNYTADIFTDYLHSRKDMWLQDTTVLTRAYQNFDMAAIYTIHGFCNKVIRDYQFECMVNTEFDLVVNKSDIIENIVRDFMRLEIINKFKQNTNNVINNLELLFSSNNYSLTLEQRIAAKLPKDLLKIEANQYIPKYTLNESPRLDKLTLIEMEDPKLCKAEFLAYLIEHIVKHYPLYLAKTNTVSYDELIQRVADTLNNSPSLCDKLFNTYPVAFIDEFQDTDSLQWQIFRTIYNLNQAYKRGNVVVVGDPKQAIYRFRGADVDTYIEARNQINNCLELGSNFRSHHNIMNFINQLFSLANQKATPDTSFFGKGIDYLPVQAQGVAKIILPSTALLKQIADEVGVNQQFYADEVQIVAINGSTKPLRSVKLLQSMTFEILSLLKADPGLAGKIAILVSKNKEGSEIVVYLRKYGVKASELKLGNIYVTATASNLYLFLNAVFDLTNRKNFIRAITSGLFNQPLTILNSDSDTANPVLQRLQEDFFRYQQIWNVNGLISLIYALLNDLFSHSINEPVLNNRELANIWQLAELLNSSPVSNQTELLFWFKQKINNAENGLIQDIDGNNEELVRLDNDDEQIIITTQHKVKGLEYEIVFCPYFKNGVFLDGLYDFNYKRPFFSNYRDKGNAHSEMIMDKALGEYIVNNENKESHRLNYVALTRARSRVYIYLKQHTYTKAGTAYNSSERPDKLVELFGYNKTNPNDSGHSLFNYPDFFTSNPANAIKSPELLPGVVVYNRNDLTNSDLEKFKFKQVTDTKPLTHLHYINQLFIPGFSRQSYSGLTHKDNYFESYYSDNDDTDNPVAILNYRYSILNDKILKGATFGTLFHALCEEYPFNEQTLTTILNEYNVDTTQNNYLVELPRMLDEAFSYPLIGKSAIRDFTNSMHELEFNLQIKDNILIATEIHQLISNYFGPEHPFSISSKSLGAIEKGFLVGFIDLVFIFEGKYWVLDYKTNTLTDYTSTSDIRKTDNPLIESMAEHHYYLQYLLYLVALKRYLEQRLKIADATDLIGGAVYYYVRGIYLSPDKANQGIYTDNNCAGLIRDLDNLFGAGI